MLNFAFHAADLVLCHIHCTFNKQMRGRANKAVGYVVIKLDNFKIKIFSSVLLRAL
jgi:hypothetical protein